MHTVQDILKLSTDFLEEKGIANARRQSEDLLADVLQTERLQLYMEFERPLAEEELKLCRERLRRRSEGEPLAYIAGEVEFLDCQIALSRNVLIPRQETEILVDRIAKQLEKEGLEEKVLWDLCTGSGCVAIALKKRFPSLRVIASDLSEEALLVAKENAKKNKVEVEFFHGDLFAAAPEEKIDYLVCNPPYVTMEEYEKLDPQVRDWEPKMALVGGSTGLEFYDRLSKELPGVLKSKGLAWFEMGTGQGDKIKNMFNGSPWGKGEVEQDWAGHDRFFFLARE